MIAKCFPLLQGLGKMNSRPLPKIRMDFHGLKFSWLCLNWASSCVISDLSHICSDMECGCFHLHTHTNSKEWKKDKRGVGIVAIQTTLSKTVDIITPEVLCPSYNQSLHSDDLLPDPTSNLKTTLRLVSSPLSGLLPPLLLLENSKNTLFLNSAQQFSLQVIGKYNSLS